MLNDAQTKIACLPQKREAYLEIRTDHGLAVKSLKWAPECREWLLSQEFNSVLMKGSNHRAAHALMTRLSALLQSNVFLRSLSSYLLLREKGRRQHCSIVAVNGSDEFLKGSWISDVYHQSEEMCVVHLQHNRSNFSQKMLNNNYLEF